MGLLTNKFSEDNVIVAKLEKILKELDLFQDHLQGKQM